MGLQALCGLTLLLSLHAPAIPSSCGSLSPDLCTCCSLQFEHCSPKWMRPARLALSLTCFRPLPRCILPARSFLTTLFPSPYPSFFSSYNLDTRDRAHSSAIHLVSHLSPSLEWGSCQLSGDRSVVSIASCWIPSKQRAQGCVALGQTVLVLSSGSDTSWLSSFWALIFWPEEWEQNLRTGGRVK